MTNRADLRASLRIRLEDPTPAPLWSDAMLHDFLAEALDHYSSRFPAQQTSLVIASGGERALPLTGPTSERDIVRVRQPSGVLLAPAVADDPAPGWSFWNGALVLSAPAAAGEWQIDSYAPRPLPGDDITPIELSTGGSEIVVLFAAASALLRRSVEVGKRGMESSSLALVRVAEAYERSAESLISARFRRATGSRLVSIS